MRRDSKGVRGGRSPAPGREARARLFPLIEQVNADQEPVEILSKKGTALLVSEAQYRSMTETAYLMASASRSPSGRTVLATGRDGSPKSIGGSLAIANRKFVIQRYDEANRDLTGLTLERDLPEWRESLGSLFAEARTASEFQARDLR